MMIRKPCIVLIAAITFTACEKAISFKPNDSEPVIVVEATIENGQPPLVVLSKSMNYFSTIDPGLLTGSFVHNADITISNGSKTHRLKEYAIPAGNGYAVYYYSTDTADPATSFTGEQATGYSLNIKAAGREYSATTTIPPLAKRIDSLWWVRAPGHPDTSKVMLMGRFIDPPGYGNYIRYFTQVDQDGFYPGLASVFDDQIVDGTTYSFQIEKGVDRNDDIDFEEYSFFEHGDSVTVRFCNIDKATYDFWRTMEYSYSSIGNPFSSPTKVLSNIKGGGLGYFGGYAVQYKSLKIPR